MLEIGSVIAGTYKILSVIGRGGMSTVYLAMNERANKPWAIKEVRKDGTGDFEVVRQSLIVETDMLKQLKHPCLPSIVDVIDSEGCFLIVMDYIEGNTLLKTLQENGAQPQEHVIEWAKQLCDVLGYLHTRKPPIIYRDLKPGNIMLKPDGNITLIDFGTARTYKRENIEDTTCLGTRGYAAPEQFGGRGQTDERTDIYCLGATLYHLVTGHNPSSPPYEIYPIRKWDQNLSAGLEQIISKCTQQDPDKRYQSYSQVLYDLEHYEEIDNSFRRSATLKLVAFGASALISCACIGGSIALSELAGSLEDTGYNNIINDAGSLDSTEQIEKYGQAISLKPSEETGYLELLNKVYLADDNFSVEEDEELRELLITHYDKDHTYKDMLMSNEEAYEDFAYNLGLAYFYYYDEEGDKKKSASWFNIAAESDTLPYSKVKRAERLGKIADYYTNIGKPNKSGDSKVSYADYWKDLKAITEGDIAAEDNSTTALMVYKEMISQIYKNAPAFKADGISYKEMKEQIDNISSRLESDIECDTDSIKKMKENLEESIVSAERALENAFSSDQQD